MPSESKLCRHGADARYCLTCCHDVYDSATMLFLAVVDRWPRWMLGVAAALYFHAVAP